MSIPKRFLPEKWFSEEYVSVATVIYNDDRKAMKRIIKDGLNINKPDKNGMNYLAYAVLIDNYEMTELLLENGADPNGTNYAKDVKFVLPLEISCCERHDIKLMKLLIKYGADVNIRHARLPLGCAQLASDKEKIRYLLQYGADINKKDYDTYTVISAAAMAKDWNMVEFLWDLGADPLLPNKDGKNVSYWLQKYIDRFGEDNKNMLRVKKRLESIGVKFPYVLQKPELQPQESKVQDTTKNEDF